MEYLLISKECSEDTTFQNLLRRLDLSYNRRTCKNGHTS